MNFFNEFMSDPSFNGIEPLIFNQEADDLMLDICKELVDRFDSGDTQIVTPTANDNDSNASKDIQESENLAKRRKYGIGKVLPNIPREKEELKSKLEASKQKLHQRYQESLPKRKIQVLEPEDCPDLKRSKKCNGVRTKTRFVQLSSILKKKSTFRGRVKGCR